jgi:hypothetical protein
MIMVRDAFSAGTGAALLPYFLVAEELTLGRLVTWGVAIDHTVAIWGSAHIAATGQQQGHGVRPICGRFLCSNSSRRRLCFLVVRFAGRISSESKPGP